MQFASFSFFVFFALAGLAYFKFPKRHRWVVLLSASLYFYAAFIQIYLLLALPLVALDFWGAQAIERTQGSKRRAVFISFIGLHLLALGTLKYSGFAGEILSDLLGMRIDFISASLITPIGLSYQTLMSLSYLSEVNAGRMPAARKLQTVALYLLFFPQLQAGPIERPQGTMPQFEAEHEFDYGRVTGGLRRMAFGFFKKLVIADRLAAPVNVVYGDVQAFGGPQLAAATFLYALQIYADFSGYTDIALGAARVFGIKLTENFRQPYFSRSVTEFWQRWHISLSTWLRDYLYFPLARKLRAASLRWLALFTTFVISGLWHGADWTFVAWGALHGAYLAAELLAKNFRAGRVDVERKPSWARGAISVVLTFVAVSFAWIFFRAGSLDEAIYVAGHLFSGWGQFIANLPNIEASKQVLFSMGFGLPDFVLTLLAIPALFGLDWLETRGSLSEALGQKPARLRWSLYYALVLAIIFFGVFGESIFIYFQF